MKSFKEISVVIGTRPEAIKLAPLIIELKKSQILMTRVILTGQHKDMVTQVMDLFEIKEDINFEIMNDKQTLEDITSKVLNKLNNEFLNFRPDLLIVQGDTTTSFASALAAFYKNIPIAHVEAGLRTNNLLNPFPEEVNRRLISQMASLHFAPTNSSAENLQKSNVLGSIHLTGNTVIDALYLAKKKKPNINLTKLGLKKNNFILITIHRRENWGEKLESIILAIKTLLEIKPDLKIILPMHKNEVLRKTIKKILEQNPRAILIEPLNYVDLIYIIENCYLLITDSGGLQEEAPSLGKPVLVVRETTERQEAINARTAILVGTKKENIVKNVIELIENKDKYNLMAKSINPYGDGKSSKRIVEICKSFLFDNI